MRTLVVVAAEIDIDVAAAAAAAAAAAEHPAAAVVRVCFVDVTWAGSVVGVLYVIEMVQIWRQVLRDSALACPSPPAFSL